MFVTYSPDGAEPQRWTFYPQRLKVADQEEVQRVLVKGRDGQGGRMTYAQWTSALYTGDATARRVLLWWLMKSEGGHDRLRLEDVDYAPYELEVEMCLEELEEMRAHLVRTGALSHTQAAIIDEELTRAESDPFVAALPTGRIRLPLVE